MGDCSDTSDDCPPAGNGQPGPAGDGRPVGRECVKSADGSAPPADERSVNAGPRADPPGRDLPTADERAMTTCEVSLPAELIADLDRYCRESHRHREAAVGELLDAWLERRRVDS